MTRAFVGGTIDPTGLTHLGAREYDPVLGRLISVDPVMDLSSADVSVAVVDGVEGGDESAYRALAGSVPIGCVR